MATTATLVGQGHNHLRYLLVADGEGGATVTLTTTGAATPDLLTDSLGGPLKECAEAFTTGLGKLAAGAKTQAQSRAIWLADSSDTVLGNGLVPRAICDLTNRSGSAGWVVDANVAGGHPTVVISAPNSGNSTASAYLDVHTQGPIGL